jgi:hypothetical protein
MIRPSAIPRGIAAVLALAFPSAALAEGAIFDVYYKGLKAAEMSFDLSSTGQAYDASGRVTDAGVLGYLVTFKYSGAVKGSLSGDRFQPTAYAALNITRKNQRHVTMSFSGGRPVKVVTEPERNRRDYDVDPTTQDGVLDPLTAAVALLSERPVSDGCAASLDIFDGFKRSQIVVSDGPASKGGGLTCKGVYRRIAGFPPDEMADRSDFPFTLELRPNAGGMLEVASFAAASTIGNIVAERR